MQVDSMSGSNKYGDLGPAWTQTWPPAWLQAPEIPPAAPVVADDCPSECPIEAPQPPTLDAPSEPAEWTDAPESPWESISGDDYAHMTAPRHQPAPCVWCGGRLRHSPLCVTRTWVPTLPFGKHKGRRADEVPRDYLRWLLGKATSLDVELRAGLVQALGDDEPAAKRAAVAEFTTGESDGE